MGLGRTLLPAPGNNNDNFNNNNNNNNSGDDNQFDNHHFYDFHNNNNNCRATNNLNKVASATQTQIAQSLRRNVSAGRAVTRQARQLLESDCECSRIPDCLRLTGRSNHCG